MAASQTPDARAVRGRGRFGAPTRSHQSRREGSVSPPTSSDSISDEEVPIYSHESKGLAVDGDHAQLATQMDGSKSLSGVESLPAELLIKVSV